MAKMLFFGARIGQPSPLYTLCTSFFSIRMCFKKPEQRLNVIFCYSSHSCQTVIVLATPKVSQLRKERYNVKESTPKVTSDSPRKLIVKKGLFYAKTEGIFSHLS